MEELAPDRQRAARAIEEFLRALGLEPERDPELARTGAQVASAFADDLLSGYRMDPARILADTVASDSDTSRDRGSLISVRGIETTITCPHHLMPATGVVHLAYQPDQRVVGLGALGRLVDCFARRLILQEALVRQIVDALVEHLDARGAAAVAVLSPTCLTARGERRSGAAVTSIATAGSLRPGQPMHDGTVALLAAEA